MTVNLFADGTKAFVDVDIGKMQSRYSEFSEIVVSFCIVKLCVWFIVLRTVKLDDQMRLGTIEIGDIRTDHFLSVKGEGQRF